MSDQDFHPIFPSDRQLSFEAHWGDQHGVPAESLAKLRWVTQEGYRLPDMASHFRTWCAGLEWLESQAKPVVVNLPPMNPKAGRLVTTLAKSMHAQYVKAIEASGAKVAK